MKDLREYNLLEHNTFGISEVCRRFVEFDSVGELREIVATLKSEDSPLLLLGGGSNLLLTGRFEGTVIHSCIKGIEEVKGVQEVQGVQGVQGVQEVQGVQGVQEVQGVQDKTFVFLRCGSGEVWDDVVEYAVSHDLYGMENLSIIPGEVGASAVQNIGAYGAEAKDVIYEVEAVEIATGEIVRFKNEDCQYGYRQSKFKNEWKDKFIITHVTYCLSKTFTPKTSYGNIQSELDRRGISNPTARDIRNVVTDIRNAKLPDPKIEGNAGSFFMNPVVSRQKYEELAAKYENMPHYTVDEEHEKIPAGWMIDQCGWKGRALGPAAVHSKQALVLVNKGGAKGADIIALCKAIQKDVKAKFGIDIHPEVNFV